ncbi:ATP-binding cassette domain-containing protein [Labilibaculum sp. A4]|uniref:ATP-binding cassette domain-containing protein n=2 Tax=Labilibaculum TaxID=2060722 RepID=A0A425YCY1_9BACT|nr:MULTISPECIES: ATP-binding cassette domain-containing protein [Labilibaculum]MDQ1769870.1 ATP-binding cassette domain-containing protein [Labilibaculum euxinus]MUP37855.1 ATP-binding cassette domain-containing protein [Labilibaculum euxinus]MVB07060.1 ATP-binding cassette domain-containing protein [Labilibaculum euxinus]MWN76426.1 ATP-binding cassette domain-containing protein [Labilibaculum euxinus]PKQ68995.1 gliding motility-associated ABC transporter ATP-binding subunit GldA [Labilibaculu
MDIVVEHLTKRYGPQKAVDNVSFRVKAGEVLGFLGPNGAGKTTTMKAMACFIKPEEGDILVGGYSIHDHPEIIKKNIGYLAENNPLYQEMNIIDFLEFIAKIHGIPKYLIPERILDMIRTCGLEGEKHKLIGELSKGYQQRVGLAQALIHDPDILILDEPTTGLDPNQIVEIRELIKRIGKEKTVILSSHILAEVEATCDRILIINNGRIVVDGTAAELRKQAQGNEILKLGVQGGDIDHIFESLFEIETIDSIDIIDVDKQLFEIQSLPNTTSVKAIFDTCVRNNYYITELTPTEKKLEDIFRILTLH